METKNISTPEHNISLTKVLGIVDDFNTTQHNIFNNMNTEFLTEQPTNAKQLNTLKVSSYVQKVVDKFYPEEDNSRLFEGMFFRKLKAVFGNPLIGGKWSDARPVPHFQFWTVSESSHLDFKCFKGMYILKNFVGRT